MKNYKILLISLISVFAISAGGGVCRAEAGGVYYVSKNGSDTAAGSSKSPFATISHAAEVMTSGDVCYIREGTYYETVNISGLNGAAFKAFGNEKVTISGCEEITGWQKYDDSLNIYSADMNWDVYEGAGNMLFANGELCSPSRWPNAKPEGFLDRENYARVTLAGGDGITIADSNLPNVDLTGAKIWCAAGVAYWSNMANVTAHDAANKTITVGAGGLYPIDGNLYFLTDSLALTDTPGEWYKDKENGKIYMCFPENTTPAQQCVEARKREYALRIENSSDIVFDGINVRGGLVEIADNTENIAVKNAVIESVDCNMANGRMRNARGIVLGGTNNLITKCEIKNMYGPGIKITGSGNRVINNYVHDINFEHNNGADGITISGKNHLISRNTVKKTGRSAIGGRFEECVISYNDVSDASRISRDSGTMYFNAHDYQNSEIHHNIIHDSMNNEGLQYALYLDSFTTSMIVYNNLIYNNETDEFNYKRLSLLVNFNSLNNVFVNNTFINTADIPYYRNADVSGAVFINNLFRSTLYNTEDVKDAGTVFKNNLEGKVTAFRSDWVDPENGNFTLAEDSPAVDGGIVVPGINEDYEGNAPDCGAFEYGKEPWTAGCDFSKDYIKTEGKFEANNKIPFKNVAENRGFEDGTNGWTVSGGSVFSQHSWEYWGAMTKEGEHSLMLRNGGKASQKITGLKPYTSYFVGGYGLQRGNYKIGYGFFEALDSAKNRLSVSKVEPMGLSGIAYMGYVLDFGAGGNSITVGIKNPKEGSGINIHSGSADGAVTGSVSLEKSSDISGWVWKNIPISETLSGNNTVYLEFTGDCSGMSVGGLYPYYNGAGDKLILSAVSDSGEEKSLEFNSESFNAPMRGFKITTGGNGEIDIEISKTGEYLNGYADQIKVAEYPFETSGSLYDKITAEFVSAADAQGKEIYAPKKGKANSIKLKIGNTNGQPTEIKAFLYALRGGEYAACGTEKTVSLEAGGEKEVQLDISLPLLDGQELYFAAADGSGEMYTLKISERDFESRYTQEGLYVKDFSVRNAQGTLIADAKAGEFNIFEVSIKNNSDTAAEICGILAVYDTNGRLCEMMRLSQNEEANRESTFGIGTVIPNVTGSVKVFVWDKLTGLNPMTKDIVFSKIIGEE